MKIGELAREAGVAIDTVRYYERQGLLPEAERTLSGYRRYAAPDVERVRFIRRAKALGFTLSEIGELLALSERRGADMAGMKRAAEAKLHDVDARIAELQRIRGGLEVLVASCPGRGELEHCPILGTLSGDDQ
ncbi:heavy metal-responsive transcriptional regulator [Cognatiluteimonas lumbrici]|uniref:heavy metal-responsive transcriptional regulator n=1 Tax=Cognatiluteimonas lumbrici TaxID=2559601 RepID=UPI00112C89FF|nr:heavy metal-responsive transcriptional regulator [Luteimonas lumbrici]